MEDILYKLGVQVALEAPGLAVAADLAIKAFESIRKAAGGVGPAALEAQRRLDGMMRSMRTMLIGAGITAGGLVGLDILKDWVKGASAMSTAMAQLQVTTGGTRGEMDALESSFVRLTRTSQLSTLGIASVAQAAAGAGLTNAKQLLATLPALTAYADVLQRTRGVAPGVSVPAAVKAEALFGIQPGTARYNAMLNAIGQASKISGDPTALLGQLRQTGPLLVGMGIRPEQVVPYLALQQQLGLGSTGGGRGGLAAILRGLIPAARFVGAKPTTATAESRALGIPSLFDKAGNFKGIDRMLMLFAQDAKKINDPQRAESLFKAALGPMGGPLAIMLSRPGVMAQTAAIQQRIGTGNLAQDQAALMQTPAAQWTVLKNELGAIGEILGKTLLPGILRVVTGFARAAGAVADFLEHHKDVAKFVATFVEFATAAALVVGPIMLAAGALGVLSWAIAGIGLPMAVVGVGLAGLAVVIGAVVFAATHWGEISRGLGPTLHQLGGHVGTLGGALGDLGTAFGDLFKALKPILKPLGDMDKLFGNITPVKLFTGALKDMIRPLTAIVDMGVYVVTMLTDIAKFATWATNGINGLVKPVGDVTKGLGPLGDALATVGKGLGGILGWFKAMASMATGAQFPVVMSLLQAFGIAKDNSPAAAWAKLARGAGDTLLPHHSPHPPVLIPHGRGGGGPVAMVPLSMASGRLPAAHHGPITVHVGGIHVHGAPNESAEALANRVQRKVVDGINQAIAHQHYYGTTDDTIYSGTVKPPLRGY